MFLISTNKKFYKVEKKVITFVNFIGMREINVI